MCPQCPEALSILCLRFLIKYHFPKLKIKLKVSMLSELFWSGSATYYLCDFGQMTALSSTRKIGITIVPTLYSCKDLMSYSTYLQNLAQ